MTLAQKRKKNHKLIRAAIAGVITLAVVVAVVVLAVIEAPIETYGAVVGAFGVAMTLAAASKSEDE